LSTAMRDRRLAALEAAALVRAVIAEVDAAIFAFDAESRLELVNRAGERLLRDSEEQLRGQTADAIGLGDLLEMNETATIERSFAGVTARWNVRRSTFRREGEAHQLLVVADISRALREEEVRAWQRLVRVLGHELNNSLAPIKSISGSLLEVVSAGSFDDARLHADLSHGLGIITRRADTLTRFLSAYSQLARLPEPTLREIELGALVRRCATLDRRVDVAIVDGLPLTLQADEDQLEQLLINLLKNAIDAALVTGGGVSISWRRDDGWVEVTVVDDGPGLASTANLFVPFFTTKPGGTGIGLVLSRQIAEGHGGSLVLRNRHDRSGCEAVVRVPVSA
jgi:two-component system nitrogen regulation sensor histidine kinase NtrY